MLSDLEVYAANAAPVFEETSQSWTPLLKQACSFPPEIFHQVMLNLIRNPNINTSYLCRADISLDCPYSNDFQSTSEIQPRLTHIEGYELKTVMVRTMIPRNTNADKPLDQTCLFHEHITEAGEIRSLVTYLPHLSAPEESPFYHPAVRGIGFLHTFNPKTLEGSISIHYSFFPTEPRSTKLERTAQHLLLTLFKHGKGCASGYVKRVKHDMVIPQATVQNTYARLKKTYAKKLCEGWVEDTDPGKHVFEDLNIAAFLIELWADMYKDKEFPGFVDIGCGNGLLVHILIEEGYKGWGFDARRRKSWSIHSPKTQENLKEHILIPSIIQSMDDAVTASFDSLSVADSPGDASIHNGVFPKGTFIVSNHADELTPWTPILANISQSPFISIPCCSHALTGARFRAPPPKDPNVSHSTYASLVLWVSQIAKDCGWIVEKEMLRIPSTRNTALIGRHREVPFEDVDIKELLQKYGGANGWEENAMKLVKCKTRGH